MYSVELNLSVNVRKISMSLTKSWLASRNCRPWTRSEPLDLLVRQRFVLPLSTLGFRGAVNDGDFPPGQNVALPCRKTTRYLETVTLFLLNEVTVSLPFVQLAADVRHPVLGHVRPSQHQRHHRHKAQSRRR